MKNTNKKHLFLKNEYLLGGGAGELSLYQAELLAVDPPDHALDDPVIVTLEEETSTLSSQTPSSLPGEGNPRLSRISRPSHRPATAGRSSHSKLTWPFR